MTAHTREPWTTHPRGSGKVQHISAAGKTIVQAWDFEESEANARRICAAVNACAGISTEALEGDPLRNLLAALLTDHQTMEPHHAHLCPLCESVQVLLEEPKP